MRPFVNFRSWPQIRLLAQALDPGPSVELGLASLDQRKIPDEVLLDLVGDSKLVEPSLALGGFE